MSKTLPLRCTVTHDVIGSVEAGDAPFTCGVMRPQPKGYSMDKNELAEAIQELSGEIMGIGQRIGTVGNNVDDLTTLHENLGRALATLGTHIRVLRKN